MHTMQVPWIWSIAPIPLLLLFSTWLRAPHWVREDRRWSARTRAAAALLIPAAALLVTVPVYRVHEIPLVYPDDNSIKQIASDGTPVSKFPFNSTNYLPPITSEALATGEQYRKVNDIYVSMYWSASDKAKYNITDLDDAGNHNSDQIAIQKSRIPNKIQLYWLQENADCLALLLEVTKRPNCVLDDPNTMKAIFQFKPGLFNLLVIDGRRLEQEGKLDEAADRYFALAKVAEQLSDHQPTFGTGSQWFMHSVMFELSYWATQKGQTPERIAGAIKRLKQLDSRSLHFGEEMQANYIIVRLALLGDESARDIFFQWQQQHYEHNDLLKPGIAAQTLLSTLMPWENDRALRMANLITAKVLEAPR